MSNSYFQFKQFTIQQDRCAMKVTTDGCLFGAWVAEKAVSKEPGVASRESLGAGMPVLVDNIFEVVDDDNNKNIKIRILDIGTGTGLLTLMVAQKSKCLADAVEIDNDAFEQAKENVQSSPWSERIHVIRADANVFNSARNYDIIISNPPFYENELKSPDKRKNIAHHGGLRLKELMGVIHNNLAEDGEYFLLLPYKRYDEAEKLINSNKLSITEKILVRQSIDHDFFRVMIRGSHAKEKNCTLTSELSIRDDRQQYTPGFIDLLKDYYLRL